MTDPLKKTAAIKFIVLLGVVSLFADMTYEGARSITGPFLSILGASGAIVGLVVGLGEFLGYGIRALSGILSDKTEKYWAITFIGYIINLLVIPLLALANNWELAAFLIVLERIGKAIRVPARDAMLSYASKQTGHGWGFGLHEALDQIGAILGPLLISVLLYFKESYQFSFAFLLLPAILSLITLTLARIAYPRPQDLEPQALSITNKGLSNSFWIYSLAVGFVALGFVDFALIAYHFQKASSLTPIWIPFFYSVAMAVDGLAALVMGKFYDTKGLKVLMFVTAISAFFVPLVFFGGFYIALLGIILWGIGMGSQESIMRAVVATLVPSHKRGSAYGMLSLVFGTFWASGSFLKGYLYDVSILSLVIFSLIAQIASIPIFLLVKTSK